MVVLQFVWKGPNHCWYFMESGSESATLAFWFLMNLCMCMCRCRCICRLRYSCMWKSRCRSSYPTLMALVPALIAELLLVSSFLSQSTCSNLRTGLTAPACCCPARTSSSRETVRWTESWARLHCGQNRIQPMRFDTKGFLVDSFIC